MARDTRKYVVQKFEDDDPNTISLSGSHRFGYGVYRRGPKGTLASQPTFRTETAKLATELATNLNGEKP